MKRTAEPTPSRGRQIGRTGARVWITILCFLAVSAVSSVLLAGLQRVLALNDNVIVLTQFATAVGALVSWLIFGSALCFPPVERLGWARPAVAAMVLAVLITAVLHAGRLLRRRRVVPVDAEHGDRHRNRLPRLSWPQSSPVATGRAGSLIQSLHEPG